MGDSHHAVCGPADSSDSRVYVGGFHEGHHLLPEAGVGKYSQNRGRCCKTRLVPISNRAYSDDILKN